MSIRHPLNDSSFTPESVGVSSSLIPRPHRWTADFPVGRWIPCYVDENVPGDNFSARAKWFARMASPPIVPVMDDCTVTIATFACPIRILWDSFPEFCGERKASEWITGTTPKTIPTMNLSLGFRSVGDFHDMIGIPTTLTTSLQRGWVSSLFNRCYIQIWNDWLRNEAIQDPIPLYTGDNEDTPSSTNKLNQLLPSRRAPDLYGSCTVSPQLGDAVKVALSGWANVEPSSSHSLPTGTGITYPKMTAMDLNGTAISSAGAIGYSTGSGVVKNNTSTSGTEQIVYNNLIIDGDKATALGVDIRALRIAVQTQKMLERLSVSGNRYPEIVYALFSVPNPDARMQRSELLAIDEFTVNMQEVTQTSGTVSGQTPIGYVGGQSKTFNSVHTWNHSYSEHCITMTLFTVRHNRSYSQGVHPMFTRREFLDFYNPVMQNIENMPVYKREIYAVASGGSFDPMEIWGYNEPWASYKYGRHICAGHMNPGASNTVGDIWTYCDYYSQSPTLSASWLEEGDTEFARTLSDPTGPNFIGEVSVELSCARPMLMHSMPGLMDHF